MSYDHRPEVALLRKEADQLRDRALLAAREIVAGLAEPETVYGFFPGGDADPRDFDPDEESCTPKEIAAHSAAVDAWNRGERPMTPRSGRFEEINVPVPGEPAITGKAIVCGSRYGIGVYTIRNPEAEAVLKQIDDALAPVGAES